jgi:hypothetical protein
MPERENTLDIENTTLFEEAPIPANGDPYVAVAMETNDNGVAIEQTPFTLGTGFESIDDIAAHVQEILAHPGRFDTEIPFLPDRVEIFCIAGSVEFDLATIQTGA